MNYIHIRLNIFLNVRLRMFFKKSLFYQIFVCLLVDSLALWEFRATAGDRMLSAFHDTVDSVSCVCMCVDIAFHF